MIFNDKMKSSKGRPIMISEGRVQVQSIESEWKLFTWLSFGLFKDQLILIWPFWNSLLEIKGFGHFFGIFWILKKIVYFKNKVIGPNLVCYIILTFLWFFQLSFTRYGSFEQTEDSSLSKNHLPPLGADPALGRHDPGRPLQLLARAHRLGPRQGPRQAQRVSGRGPIQFRNRWNFVSLLQCFKDLCKLNFLMMVWF